jgi:drug/metabolite transporter (DMT)-like permease
MRVRPPRRCCFSEAVGIDGTGAIRLPTWQEAAAFGYLAVVVIALGLVLWYSGVRRLGVERAGLFAGLVPVAALVTSAAVGAATLTLPVCLERWRSAPGSPSA